jgi:hypothetical protein
VHVHRGRSHPAHGPTLRGFTGRLAVLSACVHAGGMDEEEGIFRDEVQDIIGALADIKFDVKKFLWYIEGDDDEWEEEEETEDPPGDD